MESILLSYGLPGVVIIGLVYALIDKNKECKDWQQKAIEQANLRTADMKDVSAARDERDIKVANMVELLYQKLVVGRRG